MKLNELSEWLLDGLRSLDHDEITEVEDKRRGTELTPDITYNHVLVRAQFANSGTGTVQVFQITGPGIAPHADSKPPKQGW